MQAYLTRSASRNCFNFWTGMRGSFPQRFLPFREAHAASNWEGKTWRELNPFAARRQQEVEATNSAIVWVNPLRYITRVLRLTRQEQLVLGVVLSLLLVGWAVRAWRTAHRTEAAPPAAVE
jgi:hypothetical protein